MLLHYLSKVRGGHLTIKGELIFVGWLEVFVCIFPRVLFEPLFISTHVIGNLLLMAITSQNFTVCP